MALFCPECGRENSETARFCIGCGDTLSSSSAPLLDSRYRVIKTIKSGGMGCVYKAMDTRLDTIVALKKMLPYYSSSSELREAAERFRKEAKLLSQFHHGGLPKVMDYFTAHNPLTGDPECYIVMTHIEGSDLEAMHRKSGSRPFPVGQVVEWCLQILDILHYLHTRMPPLVYRDIKPANIMIAEGKVFLVDFGVARVFIPEHTLTAIGTDGYAAPEQCSGRAEPRSDLYSLGVVMHYLLTGIDPQAGTDIPFKPLSELNKEIPEALSILVLSLVEKESEKRPPHAMAVRDSLVLLKDQLTSTAVKKKAVPRVKKKKVATEKESRPPSRKYATIFDAVEKGDTDAVHEFLKNGVRLVYEGGYEVSEYRSLIGKAVEKGNKDIVKLLIENGADVNSRCFDKTCIHVAIENEDMDMIKLLVENGADVNEDHGLLGASPRSAWLLTGGILKLQSSS
ncbi:MAG: protein kinase [Candidatus Eremiobacteraeota bacterium]|nr:protein kinase [Candidatus Eremiobacteraeota bacterium]